jgi:hypothetical protein
MAALLVLIINQNRMSYEPKIQFAFLSEEAEKVGRRWFDASLHARERRWKANRVYHAA